MSADNQSDVKSAPVRQQCGICGSFLPDKGNRCPKCHTTFDEPEPAQLVITNKKSRSTKPPRSAVLGVEWLCSICGAPAPDYRPRTARRMLVALPCRHKNPLGLTWKVGEVTGMVTGRDRRTPTEPGPSARPRINLKGARS